MAIEREITTLPQNNVTRISSETKIVGNIVTQHDIRIEGLVEGQIKTDGKLVIGDNGKCKGEVECKSVDISGTFVGVLRASELASLRDKCIFTGELHSDHVSIEPTVLISGQIISPELSNKKDGKKPPIAPLEPAPTEEIK